MKKMIKKVIRKIAKHKKQIKLIAIELLFIVLLVATDLLTKIYIYGAANVSGGIPIIKGVLKFLASENTGASFGMFQDKTALLAVFSGICTVALFVFLIYTINNRNKLFRSALVLIIAGAAGNLYDRFVLGYVRDFIYFELINYPIFNFADATLVVGCILFLIYVIFYYNEKTGFTAKKINEQKEQLVTECNNAQGLQDKGITAESKDTATENKDITAENKDTTLENKDITLENKDIAVNDSDIDSAIEPTQEDNENE